MAGLQRGEEGSGRRGVGGGGEWEEEASGRRRRVGGGGEWEEASGRRDERGEVTRSRW